MAYAASPAGLLRGQAENLGQVHAGIDDRIDVAAIELPHPGRRVVAVGHELGRPTDSEPVDQAPQAQVESARPGLQEHAARGVHPVRHAPPVAQRQQVGPKGVRHDRVGANVGDRPLESAQPRVRQAGQLSIGSPRIEAAEQQSHVVARYQRAGKLQDRPFATPERIGVAVRQDDAHSSGQ